MSRTSNLVKRLLKESRKLKTKQKELEDELKEKIEKEGSFSRKTQEKGEEIND